MQNYIHLSKYGGLPFYIKQNIARKRPETASGYTVEKVVEKVVDLWIFVWIFVNLPYRSEWP